MPTDQIETVVAMFKALSAAVMDMRKEQAEQRQILKTMVSCLAKLAPKE